MNTLTTSTGLRGLISTAIIGALASSFGAVCAADSSTGRDSQAVKFADLNIATKAGAVVLYARIRAAAESLCSYYVFQSDAAEDRCVHDAITNAVTKVNQPALFAVYNTKNKTPLPNALVSQSH
ncbi:MAG: UrcA family protein [Steroidobacteraceae bacterium]